FSSRRRHTSCYRDWSSDVCSSDLVCPTTGSRRLRGGFLHFYVSHLVRISRALIVSASLLALIISTGCGSSYWSESQRQTPPSVGSEERREGRSKNLGGG